MNQSHSRRRWIVGVLCVLGLFATYLFQRTDVAGWMWIEQPDVKFVVNKTLRFLINDFLVIGLLYALFYERKYVIFSIWVQVAGLVFILIPFFLLKLVWHTGNGPLVSFLHRLTINPILLLLLIPAFYFQKREIEANRRGAKGAKKKGD
jgi:exosortase F-associated protein